MSFKYINQSINQWTLLLIPNVIYQIYYVICAYPLNSFHKLKYTGPFRCTWLRCFFCFSKRNICKTQIICSCKKLNYELLWRFLCLFSEKLLENELILNFEFVPKLHKSWIFFHWFRETWAWLVPSQMWHSSERWSRGHALGKTIPEWWYL